MTCSCVFPLHSLHALKWDLNVPDSFDKTRRHFLLPEIPQKRHFAQTHSLTRGTHHLRTATEQQREHLFNARDIDWGFSRLIPLDELWEPSNGFLVNDTCIIEVEILVSKPKHGNQLDPPNNKIHDKPLKHIDHPLHEEMFTTFGKLVDFKGLGKIEQDFIPLLEEVCSQHPSLINNQKKRTHRRILIKPKGKNGKDLSIFLDAGADLANLPDDWNKFAKFKLAVVNQVDEKKTKIKAIRLNSRLVQRITPSLAISIKHHKGQRPLLITTKVRVFKPRPVMLMYHTPCSMLNLSKALNELQHLCAGTFEWQMSNAQTWTNASLTNSNACLDSFNVSITALKLEMKRRVTDLGMLTSNALYMITRLGYTG
ncbi:hypothetical protein Fmac_020300 [Flemingia macrophylla]|uniref:MATH domain-containing protein n=1 Tax=Flemingia macrophylla TaxID=520843 RepID=A0ABD1LTQ3_9FABA